MRLNVLASWSLLGLVACGPADYAVSAVADAATQFDELTLASPCWLESVTIRDFGKVVYKGGLDLEAEARRIGRGERLPYHHDGTVFQNREHRLPDAPGGYYHEYVHLTPGVRGPGPQRLVRGDHGELDYTPDHYASFLLLPEPCATLAQASPKSD
jgi:guanyl-specific ribonuclease Sa